MGKHNGKARNLGGPKVGQSLARKAKLASARGSGSVDRHTTDVGAPNMQSVLERNDLDEFMAMADLADRDFTAERGAAVVVISTGAVDPLAAERDARERKEAEARHAHKLRVPRRPHWASETTAEQLDAQERAAFLDWRRELAHLEEEEKLVLTPFERNLEVWRQLWRVLERSDIIVQVVDARDPMTYVSDDLASYAHDIDPSKRTLVLLNKSDLLPLPVRRAWADHFEAAGIDCVFWSAFAATEAQAKAKAAAAAGLEDEGPGVSARWQDGQWVQGQEEEEEDERTRVLGVEELLDVLEERAREAVESAGPDDPRSHDPDRRFMVGLVGYPNVGKSSTINAIFGSKKTAVAPTPGKTKHFQTLNVSDTICLCDCPGLVLPKFANSKSEMVAAGVIPIDRLTDVRAPVDIVAQRAGRSQLEAVYGLRLPGPKPHQAPLGIDPNAPPAAGQLLATLAGSRGWAGGSGLPDEARAGRQILKDYVGGKLLYCQLPPGYSPPSFAPSMAPTPEALAAITELPAAPTRQQQQQQQQRLSLQQAQQSDDSEDEQSEEQAGPSSGEEQQEAHGRADASSAEASAAAASGQAGAARAAAAGEPSSSNAGGELDLDEADLELLQGLQDGGKSKQKRPEYKFHKKSARSKGNRGLAQDAGGYDGAALLIGKKGGLVRVGS